MHPIPRSGTRRRGFLLGLAGALGGVLTAWHALGRASRPAGKRRSGPVLFRRTAETQRYYRTLDL